MGQFIDYRDNKNKFKEGKDLIIERLEFLASQKDNTPEEKIPERILELKLLGRAKNVRAAEALFKLFAIISFAGGIFYHSLLLVSLGFLVLAFINFVHYEVLKILIRRMINEDTN